MFRIEHNVETNEIIEIQLTDKEIKAIELERAENEKMIAESEAKLKAEIELKNIARAALLERLGITEEEAKLLLG